MIAVSPGIDYQEACTFEVEKAISYMNDHLAEKITLEDLARQTHRSSVHFS